MKHPLTILSIFFEILESVPENVKLYNTNKVVINSWKNNIRRIDNYYSSNNTRHIYKYL